jgi:hypothetical protein
VETLNSTWDCLFNPYIFFINASLYWGEGSTSRNPLNWMRNNNLTSSHVSTQGFCNTEQSKCFEVKLHFYSPDCSIFLLFLLSCIYFSASRFVCERMASMETHVAGYKLGVVKEYSNKHCRVRSREKNEMFRGGGGWVRWDGIYGSLDAWLKQNGIVWTNLLFTTQTEQIYTNTNTLSKSIYIRYGFKSLYVVFNLLLSFLSSASPHWTFPCPVSNGNGTQATYTFRTGLTGRSLSIYERVLSWFSLYENIKLKN